MSYLYILQQTKFTEKTSKTPRVKESERGTEMSRSSENTPN